MHPRFGADLSSRELPPKAEVGGYVYVIGFGGGAVKVGMTADPKTRFGTLRGTARTFGDAIENTWLSPHHLDPRSNESSLIDLMINAGGSTEQREYFTGVLFPRALELAQTLEYPAFDVAAESANVTTRGRQLREGMMRLADAAEHRPRDYHEWLDQRIGPIFGRRPDGSYNLAKVGDQEVVPDELIANLADLREETVDQVAAMDMIDMYESIALDAVRFQAQSLRLWAYKNNRGDLIAPMRPNACSTCGARCGRAPMCSPCIVMYAEIDPEFAAQESVWRWVEIYPIYPIDPAAGDVGDEPLEDAVPASAADTQ